MLTVKSPPVTMGAELPGPTHCTVGAPVTPLATLTLHVSVYGCPRVGFPPAVIDTSTVQIGTYIRFDNTGSALSVRTTSQQLNSQP